MPPKKIKSETGVVPATAALWTPAMLSTFLAQQSARPQQDFRKTAFFSLLDADALALLQAFLETKSVTARAFFYQQPWPGRDELTLIPGSPQWKARVREYIRQAQIYALQHAQAGKPPVVWNQGGMPTQADFQPNDGGVAHVTVHNNGATESSFYAGNAAGGAISAPHADQRPIGFQFGTDE